MKKMYALLFLIIRMISAQAQNNCSTPYPVYTGIPITMPLLTDTSNTDHSNDYDCLLTQPNPMWFYFKTCSAGSYNITITGSNAGSARDIDYIAWGPLSAATDCGLSAAQVVACSYSVSSAETVVINAPSAGLYYKIMVTNYSSIAGDLYIAQTSGTGSTCADASCTSAEVPTQEICKVSVDPASNKNVVIWNKDDPAYTGAFIIQKETDTAGIYAIIAVVANNDTSVFKDNTSDAYLHSFKYRIETADSCGNLYAGTLHETIHLSTAEDSVTHDILLNWNPYTGFGYSTYYIYRGATLTTMLPYDSVPAALTSYSDISHTAYPMYYSVAVLPPVPCHPSRSMDAAYSNVSSVLFVTGITENAFDNLVISPNPASNELNFSTGNTHFSAIQLEIYDLSGRKLINQLYKNTSQAQIDISNLSNGYYVLRVVTDKDIIQRNIIVAR